MTHLKAQETKSSPTARKQWKLALIERLYERGYDRSAIINLFKFVDWLLILPEDAKKRFGRNLELTRRSGRCHTLPVLNRTSVEQIGYDRGVKEAEQRSRELLSDRERSIALNMLRENLDLETIVRITGLTIAQLQQLQAEMG